MSSVNNADKLGIQQATPVARSEEGTGTTHPILLFKTIPFLELYCSSAWK